MVFVSIINFEVTPIADHCGRRVYFKFGWLPYGGGYMGKILYFLKNSHFRKYTQFKFSGYVRIMVKNSSFKANVVSNCLVI